MSTLKQERLLGDLDRLIFYAILALAFFLALFPALATVSLIIGSFFWFIKLYITKGKTFKRTPYDIAIITFVVISGLSVFVSPDPAFSFYNYYHLVGRYVFTYLLVVQNIVKMQQIKQIVYALGLSAVFVVGYGFYQSIHGIDISSMKWVDGEAFPELKTRVFSTWENPNILAGYLVVIMSIVFGLFCKLADKKQRGILTAFFCLLGICLGLTYARGACLTLALVIAGYGILQNRKILAGFIVLAIMLLTFDAALYERLLSIFTKVDTSSEMRFALWESTMAMILDHPLLGIGWGSYWMVYPEYDFYINNPAVRIVHAHNLYLNFAAEIGLAGFMSFMVCMLGHMSLALSNTHLRESKFLNGLLLGCGLAIVSILLNGFTDYVLFNIESSMLFWFLCALIVLITRQSLD
ncbi:O-antigen ligase family protein [Propionispira raffinosivorans]|uniref:O-antigen ligase family protein n=1 Tax=Propionispira raffinosivorans TaxID=86959 RepID=UPI000376F33A|nr:O-antigen ligase family protein [Propionispira raffinosivorans]